MEEYQEILKYFGHSGFKTKENFGLKNDGAFFKSNKKIAISCDSLSESIHFPDNSSPELIARRVIASNISDLSAMAALPKYYLLSIAIPKSWQEKQTANFIENFSKAIKKQQKQYNIALLGGDIIRTDGKLIITCTIIGESLDKTLLNYKNIKANHLLVVSGTIGDAALGLDIVKSKLNFKLEDKLIQKLSASEKYLVKRYTHPINRIKLGISLANLASSAIDISDGLIGDLKKLAYSSNLTVRVDINNIPISNAAKNYKNNNNFYQKILGGGDDYELLFSISKRNFESLKKKKNLPKLSVVGRFEKGQTNILLFDKNKQILTDIKSYSHL